MGNSKEVFLKVGFSILMVPVIAYLHAARELHKLKAKARSHHRHPFFHKNKSSSSTLSTTSSSSYCLKK